MEPSRTARASSKVEASHSDCVIGAANDRAALSPDIAMPMSVASTGAFGCVALHTGNTANRLAATPAPAKCRRKGRSRRLQGSCRATARASWRCCGDSPSQVRNALVTETPGGRVASSTKLAKRGASSLAVATVEKRRTPRSCHRRSSAASIANAMLRAAARRSSSDAPASADSATTSCATDTTSSTRVMSARRSSASSASDSASDGDGSASSVSIFAGTPRPATASCTSARRARCGRSRSAVGRAAPSRSPASSAGGSLHSHVVSPTRTSPRVVTSRNASRANRGTPRDAE